MDASMSATKLLDPSSKDIEVSVSAQLIHALTAGIRYYGFLLKLSDTEESATASRN